MGVATMTYSAVLGAVFTPLLIALLLLLKYIAKGQR
jgi:hypothetical protein